MKLHNTIFFRIIIFLSLILFLFSCASSNYFSSTPNVPLFKEKHEGYWHSGLRLSGMDFQTGIALGNHWGLCGSGSYTLSWNTGSADDNIPDDTHDMIWFIFFPFMLLEYVELGTSLQACGEVAFCGFQHFGQNDIFTLEAQAGYGFGANALNDSWSDIENKLKFHKIYTQLDFGIRSKYATIALGAKASKLYAYDVNYMGQDLDISPNFTLLEPLLVFAIGQEGYGKIYYRITYPIILNGYDENLTINPTLRFSLGILKNFTF